MTSVRNIAVAVTAVESGVADASPIDARAGADAAAAADPALGADAEPTAGDAGFGGRSGAVRRRAQGGPVGRRRAVGPVIGEQLAVLLLQNHQPDVLLSHQCVCGQPFPCPSRVFGTTFLGDQALLIPTVPAPSPAANAAPRATLAAPAAGAEPEPADAEPAARRATPRHGAAEVARSGGRQGARRRAAHRAESPDATPEAAPKRAAADEDLDSTQVLERIDPNAEPPAAAQPQGGADLDSTQEFQKIPRDPDVPIAV